MSHTPIINNIRSVTVHRYSHTKTAALQQRNQRVSYIVDERGLKESQKKVLVMMRSCFIAFVVLMLTSAVSAGMAPKNAPKLPAGVSADALS